MGGSRKINEQLMRSIASTWGSDQKQYFERVEKFPPGKEDRVVGYFEPDHYPQTVSNPRIELRLRVNGDLNLTYVEEWSGADWRCRWDRHENTHNAYEHFHVPPTIAKTDAVDVEYHSPPFGVVEIAFAFIKTESGTCGTRRRRIPIRTNSTGNTARIFVSERSQTCFCSPSG